MGRGQTEHSLKEDGEEEEGREPVVLTDLGNKQGGEAACSGLTLHARMQDSNV